MLSNFFQFLIAGGFTLLDLLDVVIVAIIIYNLLNLIKGTKAVQISVGISLIMIIFLTSEIFELKTLNWLFRYFFASAGLIAIILLQPEIRHFLTTLARNPIIRLLRGRKGDTESFDDLIYAMATMAEKKIGGIIIIEKNVGLKNYIDAGIKIDGLLSYDLLLAIFYPGSPLHDGAVIIRGDRIVAAACFLPLTLNPRLSRELGTRHRAAIGISEETDALAITISEERGEISIAHQGSITKPLTPKNIVRIIRGLQKGLENPEEIMKRYRRPLVRTLKKEKA